MSQIVTLYRRYGNPKIAVDYLKARDLITAEITSKGGWDSLTPKEKGVVIDCFTADPVHDAATAQTKKVEFLVSQGYSATEAALYLPKAYAMHHVKERQACLKRAESEAASTISATVLRVDDLADFIKTTKQLYDLYKAEGIKGTLYGQAGLGLMDFIESTTGTIYETTGLAQQGYEVNAGTSITMLIAGLKDILINGNYTR